MNRLWPLLVTLSLSACATTSLPPLALAPSSLYVDGSQASRLDLGGRGELFLRPRLLVTSHSPAPAPPEDVRLQVQVRVIRTDGGIMSWSAGADGDAPPGEGGRRWRPEQRGELRGVPLNGARFGPLSIGEIESVEVVAGWILGPPRQTAWEQGVRALGRAPEPGASDRTWRQTGEELRMLGVAPLIAARVALSKERERTAGTHLVRLAFVAPQGGRASPVLIRFEPAEGPEEAPWPVSLEDEALTLVVLDLELQVEPQAPRRPSVEPERL